MPLIRFWSYWHFLSCFINFTNGKQCRIYFCSQIMTVNSLSCFSCAEPTALHSCVWPTQEIKKPLQLEAYLCLNYLRMVDLNESEAGFSVVHSWHVWLGTSFGLSVLNPIPKMSFKTAATYLLTCKALLLLTAPSWNIYFEMNEDIFYLFRWIT